MKPLVSILIPAYNAEKWISDTIHSAMAQTWKNTEIIVVDDGSKDSTYEVARRFESPTIRVVKQGNQGAAAARNKAYSLSSGDYIQWLDADDLLAPDKIALQVEALQAGIGPRTLLSSEWGHFMYRANRARFERTALWCDLSPAEFLLRKMGQKIAMQTSTWLVSRELTEAAGPWDVTMYVDDDGEYFCRVLLASDGVRFVPESRVFYRVVGSSSLSYIGRSEKKLDALWRSLQIHIRSLRSLEESERVRQACIRHLQFYVIDFYPFKPDILIKMQALARELGGQLDSPRLSWKYSWIHPIFGWDFAHRIQLLMPNVKWSLVRLWDKLACAIQQPGPIGVQRANVP